MAIPMRLGALLVCAILPTAGSGDWSEVYYRFRDGENPAIVGPTGVYESVRPEAAPWTARYDLRNNHANLAAEKVRVHSAHAVHFRDFVITSGHSGKPSHVAFCIRLSEAITAVAWDIEQHGRDVTPGGVLAARYSLDGEEWTDAFVYPAGQTACDPPVVRVALERPTTVLFIGWFAEVPEGERGWWDLGNTGTLTFTPLRDAEAAVVARPPSVPLTVSGLQGSRFVSAGFFGTTTHVNSESTGRLLRDLGVPNVRVDFRWQGLEPERGRYNLDPELWMVRSADLGLDLGLDHLPVITGAPAWAMAENGTFPNDESSAALEEFMFRIASKYRGRIRYWQAMNEPNMAAWQERYITFLKAFHAGVKRADPRNRVVLCGFAGIERMQLDAVYRLGGKDYFDVIASHSYTRPDLPEEGGYLEKILALHDVMWKYGDQKPLWVTEMGWNGVEPSMLGYLRSRYPGHRNYAVTEEDQARGLARLYLLSATVPWIERVYWFHLHQEARHTEVREEADHYMGLFSPWLDGEIRPKDAYFAVKTVVGMIRESLFKERIALGDRIWALVFQRGEQSLVAIWSLDDGVTMILDDTSLIEEVASMVGTPVLVEDNGLGISGRPIYLKVRSRDVPAFAQALQTATVRGAQVLRLELGLCLERTTPERPVLSVALTNTGAHAVVAAPIVLQVQPSTWALDQTQLDARAPIPAGEQRVRRVPVSAPGGDTAGEVTFSVSARTLDGDVQVGAQRTFRYLVAGPRPEAFRADGDLGEWAGSAPVTIGDSANEREFAEWGGAKDCLATWRCAADATALYLGATVTDDVNHLPIGRGGADSMWLYDSIQVGLDVAGDAQPVANVPQYDGANDVEIGLGLTPDGPLAYAWVRPDGQPGLLALNDFAIRRDEAAGATCYEVAIPWQALGQVVPAGEHWMGMNILVNDSDGKSRRGWLEWAPGIGQTKDPSRFPKVLVRPR